MSEGKDKMNDLAMIHATVHWPGWSRCITSWGENAIGPYTRRVYSGMKVLEAYQKGFEESAELILGYVHDDVVCMEKGWDARVLAEFEDASVGMVGFGGAVGLGDIEIYNKPYQLAQLARHRFMSNMREAEAHGERFTGERDVSCLDGFAMFVRRSILRNVRRDQLEGWPVGTPVNYFMYDAWLSCEVRRQGFRTRLVGVSCDHLSGKSTGLGPERLDLSDFEAAHLYIYETCKDVLPMRVPE